MRGLLLLQLRNADADKARQIFPLRGQALARGARVAVRDAPQGAAPA